MRMGKPYAYGTIMCTGNQYAYGYPYAYGSPYMYGSFILAHMRMGILYAYGIAHTRMGKNTRTVRNSIIIINVY